MAYKRASSNSLATSIPLAMDHLLTRLVLYAMGYEVVRDCGTVDFLRTEFLPLYTRIAALCWRAFGVESILQV